MEASLLRTGTLPGHCADVSAARDDSSAELAVRDRPNPAK